MTCPTCSVAFEPKRTHGRYCSRPCKRRAFYERNRTTEVRRAATWNAAHPNERAVAKRRHRKFATVEGITDPALRMVRLALFEFDSWERQCGRG